MSTAVDAHHHFWRFNRREYDWIDDTMSRIQRDFLPRDLRKEIDAAGIDGVVTVQARQTTEETEWLLQLADEHPFIRGVVGWVPLVHDDVAETLAPYAEHPKLKAVRHVVQGEPDDDFILRSDFNRGIDALEPLDLVYDILIFERHLPQTIEFVDRHPTQRFVLDHIAKPRIAEEILEPWKRNLTELARRENVTCKLSGLVTEADPGNWTPAQLTPYMEVVLEAFGPDRVMFGSDWPVCLLGCGYEQWCALVRDTVAELSETERDAIFGKTAIDTYRL